MTHRKMITVSVLLFSVDYGSFQLHGRAVPVDIHMSFLNKYHSYRFLPFLGKSAN